MSESALGGEFGHLSDAQMLQLWSRVMAELRGREVIHSSNGPAGDYSERRVAAHFGVPLIPGPNRDYNLIRRVTSGSRSKGAESPPGRPASETGLPCGA